MEVVRALLGGLNTDDSEELLSSDDWSHAENIISGRAYLAKNGERENVRGTTVLTSDVDLTGCTHIGTIRSAEDNVSYLFYYHATSPCIVKFASGTISLVLRWSGLNFSNQKEYRINGGGIAGNLLYFTDNLNEPRCVHVTRYADGSVPASEADILHIRRGPIFAPETNFVNTTIGKPIDDVQFAYQYEYIDGQLSVISPWTNLVRGLGMNGITNHISEVNLRIPANESIPPLVSKIKLVARKGNNGTPFYWMDATSFHQITYAYKYAEQSLGVVATIYLKQFELVPLKAKASSITKSRAWFANYLEGYTTPSFSGFVGMPSITLNLIDSGIAENGITFGPNSTHRFGIVYHDGQGRSCGVQEDQAWVVSTPKVITPNWTRRQLQYKINGSGLLNIPSWAKYYSLVMTKDLVKTYFVQCSTFASAGIEPYVTVATDGTETYSMTFSSAADYIRVSLANINNKGIYYTFRDGDYAIVTNSTNNVTVGPLRVRKVTGKFVYLDSADLGNAAANFHYGVQVYTPNANVEQIYYEIARRAVTFDGLGTPSLDSATYTYYGDCVNMTTAHGVTPQMRFKPQDGAWEVDSGKPYIKTPIGQVTKKNFIRFSSPFIAGINVNGLSEFNSGDEDEVPVESVQIQRLQATSKEGSGGEVILAICNSDTYSVYVDEARMSTNDGQSLVINSVNVIGDVRKHASGFGTLHPESVMEEDGNVFWWDYLARSYVRYSTNGIFPISDYKAINYFENQARLTNENDVVVSGYDPFYKMVFVTFTNAETTVKKTIGFSLPKERWISFYNFAPNGYIIGSKTMYSIQGTSIYSHDNVTNFNQFYGTTFTSKIKVSLNDEPGTIKEWRVFKALVSPNFFSWSNGDQVISANALSVILSNRQGQQTSINSSEFDVDDFAAYGEIRADENTGTVLTGDYIYSPTLQAEITFSGGSYKQITLVSAGFEIGRGHQL